jgi:hypothetical protein
MKKIFKTVDMWCIVDELSVMDMEVYRTRDIARKKLEEVDIIPTIKVKRCKVVIYK